MKSFTLPAFAKINLGLRILRKRADGFHDLETVFLRIGWKDELTFVPGSSANRTGQPRITMSCSDPGLPIDDENLCIRAARVLLESDSADLGTQSDLHIRLDKHIPYGAGLGGGSSDAATVLKACSELWGINSDLRAVGGQLGSDVPFFFGSGVAFGSGRGEVLGDLELPQALRSTRLLVVAPEQRVGTADAYRRVQPSIDGHQDLKKLVASGSLADWRTHLRNDFEPSVFAQYPLIQELKQEILHLGAAYASMSGSGSAVFGIFTSQSASLSALATLKSTWPAWSCWEGASDAAV